MDRNRYVYAMLIVALLMAGALSLFASPEPDGLERVAEDHEFIEHGEGREVIQSPFPDYVVPGFGESPVGASLAGLVGTVLVFGLVFLAGRALAKKG